MRELQECMRGSETSVSQSGVHRMKEYIIYTTEGTTYAPDETVEIDNCQILGRECGVDSEDAIRNLLHNHAWIVEAGFDTSAFIVKQIVTDELRSDMAQVMSWISAHITKETDIHDIIKRLERNIL